MKHVVVRDAEVGRLRVDVRVTDGRIAEVGEGLEAPPGAPCLQARGGALIPGLWDHHIHLLALAARARSAVVGPPRVRDADGVAAALRAAATSVPAPGWIRAVGHHESAGGDLDSHALDAMVATHPVRVQHRSGALWILNSRAVEELGLTGADDDGVERDRDGVPTGRLYGLDTWLRRRLPAEAPPDLAGVGRRLAGRGVVGVTDATPYRVIDDLAPLSHAVARGELPQRVMATGAPALARSVFPSPLGRGPVKIVLADHDLPALDDLVAWITEAHQAERNVAVHSVTAASLVLLLAALDETGTRPGDRIEHGAVIPPELRTLVAERALVVVTQPHLIAERGDQYLVDVEPADRPHLYPCRSLLALDVPVGGSTDAPFGDPDPWRAVGAAVDRRTNDGATIGADEAVTAPQALELFLGHPDAPGGPPRRVEVGAPADLCLLHQPLDQALEDPPSVEVRATLIGGRVVHQG